MVSRSQAHLTRMGRYTSGGINPNPPPITGIAPDTATLAAAGISGRLICTITASGGTPPYTSYVLSANGGLSCSIIGQNLLTTADPAGTVGAKSPQVTVTDSRGQTKTEVITVTLT